MAQSIFLGVFILKLIEESCLTSLKVNTFGKCGHHLRTLNPHWPSWFIRGLQVDLVVGAMGFEPMMPTLWSWIQVLNLPRPKRYPTKCGALPLGHAPIIQCGFITVTAWLPQPFPLFQCGIGRREGLRTPTPRGQEILSFLCLPIPSLAHFHNIIQSRLSNLHSRIDCAIHIY